MSIWIYMENIYSLGLLWCYIWFKLVRSEQTSFSMRVDFCQYEIQTPLEKQKKKVEQSMQMRKAGTTNIIETWDLHQINWIAVSVNRALHGNKSSIRGTVIVGAEVSQGMCILGFCALLCLYKEFKAC